MEPYRGLDADCELKDLNRKPGIYFQLLVFLRISFRIIVDIFYYSGIMMILAVFFGYCAFFFVMNVKNIY